MLQQTIVIGGGVAGLAAATYLARGGRSVNVLEKASTLGGRAATDYPSGFALNRGAHALYTGGAASEVLHELGVSYSFGVPKAVFAADERGMHTLPASPVSLLRTTLLDAADKRDLLGFFVRLGTASAASLGHQSAAEWIERMVRRPRPRALIRAIARVSVYSAALDLVSADTFVGRLQQSARHPVHYVDGGWQTIVDGLRAAAVRAGAVIHTSAAVETVRIEHGRAVGVRLHDGVELTAESLVLALPPEVALHLLGANHAADLAERVGAMVPANIACLDVALQRLPNPGEPVVFDLQAPRFITAQSTVARIAPDGGGVVHVFKQIDPRDPANPHQDAADLDAAIDRVQSGWREVLVERRFLPRMLGSSLLPLAAQGGLAARPACQSLDVPNVYFSGDWIGPRGYLVDASFDSARAAARLALQSTAARRELLRAA